MFHSRHSPLLGALFLASIIPSILILYVAYLRESVANDKYSRGVCSALPDTQSDRVMRSLACLVSLPPHTAAGPARDPDCRAVHGHRDHDSSGVAGRCALPRA